MQTLERQTNSILVFSEVAYYVTPLIMDVSLFSNLSPHTISSHLPFVCINQVSGTEVTRKAIGVHEDIKRRSKFFHPKAILQGSWIGTQVFNVMLKMTVCAV